MGGCKSSHYPEVLEKSGIFSQNTEIESGNDPENETINRGEIDDVEDTANICPPQDTSLENLLNLVEEEEKLKDFNKYRIPSIEILRRKR